MASSKAIWIPPLPMGWEARYDPTKKAYFFINHLTRTTQWDDPRYPQASHPLAENPSASAFRSLGQFSGLTKTDAGVSLPLQEFSRSSHSKTQKGNGAETGRSESHFSKEINMAVIGKLQNDFPSIPRELIADILVLFHNNERETREQLKDMCAVNNFSTSSSHTTPKRSTGGASSSASANLASPKRTTLDPSPKKQVRIASPQSNVNKKRSGTVPPPPVKHEVSNADKTRASNQLKRGFPNTDPDIINIALSHCNYNIEEATELVSAWNKKYKEEEQRLKTTKVASSSNSGQTSHTVQVPVSLEPAEFDYVNANKPQGLGHSHLNDHKPGIHSTMKTSETTKPESVASGSQASSVSSGDASHHHHAKAQHVTRMSEHLLNTTNDLLNHLATTANCCTAEVEEVVSEAEDSRAHVATPEDQVKNGVKSSKVVTSQPSAAIHSPAGGDKKHSSSLRCANKGPNRSLRIGPNSSMLTSDYMLAMGPNMSLRSGPDRTRVIGPKGTQGPNASLRCGPQSSLLHKFSSNSLGHLASPSNVVVTHV